MQYEQMKQSGTVSSGFNSFTGINSNLNGLDPASEAYTAQALRNADASYNNAINQIKQNTNAFSISQWYLSSKRWKQARKEISNAMTCGYLILEENQHQKKTKHGGRTIISLWPAHIAQQVVLRVM